MKVHRIEDSRRLITRTGIIIGSAYIRPQQAPSRDAELIQRALLKRRASRLDMFTDWTDEHAPQCVAAFGLAAALLGLALKFFGS